MSGIDTPSPIESTPAKEVVVDPAGQLEQRKADHIRINVEEDVGFKKLTTGLEKYFFMHQALPELEFASLDTTTQLFDKTLQTPLLISSMTGGADKAHEINVTLAEAAQEVGMAQTGVIQSAAEGVAQAEAQAEARKGTNLTDFMTRQDTTAQNSQREMMTQLGDTITNQNMIGREQATVQKGDGLIQEAPADIEALGILFFNKTWGIG